MYTYSESEYPLSFRNEVAYRLAEHIKHHRNVELVGMKRVGISNFLRFFLYNPRVFEHHFGKKSNHLLIPVDLLDLVDQEVYPFWLLTLKRIEDAVQMSALDEETKRKIAHSFEKAIQIKDIFFTLDCIRSSLHLIAKMNFLPTLFFIRFDRIADIITPEIFGNLQSLINAANHKLTYVFTSVRRLHNLKPSVFEKTAMAVFSHEIFLQPASNDDGEIIFETFRKKYNLKLTKKVHDAVLALCGGHVQYLQLSLIILNEISREHVLDVTAVKQIAKDERILLQSEEILASLKDIEREALYLILSEKEIDTKLRLEARYIWNVGVINEHKKLFSPLFLEYVQSKTSKHHKNGESFLTKKEHILFGLLKKHEGEICERDTIIEVVWPEYTEIGVSDWAIDRLIARLRKKLEVMQSEYRIQTVKTRGFMMAKREK